MGIEPIPGVSPCMSVRVYALVKRTDAHRNPCQLLQLFILCETGANGKCDEKSTNKTT
jgi:hypothetical protein